MFSITVMVDSDHMFMLYKTDVEITLDRRRIHCARSSSRPSLRNRAYIETNCMKPSSITLVRRSMQMNYLHGKLLSFVWSRLNRKMR